MTPRFPPWSLHLGLAIGLVAPRLAASPASAAPAPGVFAPPTYLSPLSQAQVAALSANATQNVIVVLRNQHPEVPGAGNQASHRASTLRGDQAPILNELRTLQAPKAQGYSFINAVAATMSTAEAARLAADPSVLEVVPDSVVPGPSPATSAQAVAQAATGAAASPAVVTGNPAATCPSNPAQPILEPEALQLMQVNYGPGVTQPAANDLATGTGVKVAVFPDGLDPNIPDFTRNGSSVIFDYQDFSGDGINGVTGGEEAFGDASSIAAQGNQTYDLSGEVNPAHPLPAGCTIRIQGVAPGASLAVMKVFGHSNGAPNSVVLEGIDYAVSHDHVDVLSESFGGNPVPNPSNDPIAIADEDAVAAGITVVASTGDAGPTNTIGTPSSDSAVISAGASTSYREYAQTTSYGYQFGGNGWQSNNPSSPSSSGVTEFGPHTIDVVAPGENGWADCSPNTTEFTECADLFNGPDPQPIVAFGGTSEAAPLTAGVAALVIQAYRDTHAGATPSPALVKQIIKSSAQDLSIVAGQQGAGLVDALRAVQDARSIGSTPEGSGLLYSTNSISHTGAAGAATVTPVTLTNVGAVTQTVTPTVQALGPATTIASGTLQLNQATDPTFVYQTGQVLGDVHLVHFTVPAGLNQLEDQIAWATGNQPTSTVRESLFDPQGRIAAQSRPQGSGGGYGQVQVVNPAPGTWTMLAFESVAYSGPLAYTITGSAFQPVAGSVVPAVQTIGPGGSATFNVHVTDPAAPGDRAESLDFGTDAGGSAPASIPVTLRTLVPLGGSFSGILTGGNQRMSFANQELAYQFVVPPGQQNLGLNVNVQDDSAGYQLLGFLVDPGGSPVDVQSTLTPDGSQNLQTMHLSWVAPSAGTWSLDLEQLNSVSSVKTSTGISGTIGLGAPAATGSLPKHRDIPPGHTVNATVSVTNNGNSPEFVSVDPRLDQSTVIPLASLVTPTGVPLPTTDPATMPQFIVPPFSTAVQIAAQSTVPINMDTSPEFGSPEIPAASVSDDAVATFFAPDLPASVWSCGPAEQGPFAATATATTFDCGAAALTAAFDPNVSSTTGNIWSALEGITGAYAPLVLQPGQTGTIQVGFTGPAPNGTLVSGVLNVESFNFGTVSSDQIAAIPYSYR
ncbi:MAG TPA: S8 family serine peptidase [Actinomycetota bacterium]|nr:S8 family serine peptidase [Actinomycetota bacterium]